MVGELVFWEWVEQCRRGWMEQHHQEYLLRDLVRRWEERVMSLQARVGSLQLSLFLSPIVVR